MEQQEPRYPVESQTPPAPETAAPSRTGQGRLQVRASTASQALPVPGASVIVTDQEREGSLRTLLYSAKTDESGLTPEFILSSPPASESDSPGGIPFSEYEVFVSAEHFRPIRFLGVPVFDGVTTVQPAALTPISLDRPAALDVQEVPAYTSQL